MIYAPVVKNGTFRCWTEYPYRDPLTVKAVDVAEAKWKFARRIGVDVHPANVRCEVVEKTTRRTPGGRILRTGGETIGRAR
jgi:hypothetical protein